MLRLTAEQCEITKATVRLAEGRLADARRISLRSTAALERVYGADHPLTQEARAVLALKD